MIVILMGVCGCGKSTVGALLAKRWNCVFSDADDFHSPENVDKMRRGIALTDEDRWPWLATIRRAIEESMARGENRVFACSALRQVYRDVLSKNGDVLFIHLKGDQALITERMQARVGHYMNPSLIQSQFDTLEDAGDAIAIDINHSPEEIVELICQTLAGPIFANR